MLVWLLLSDNWLNAMKIPRFFTFNGGYNPLNIGIGRKLYGIGFVVCFELHFQFFTRFSV